MDSENTTPEKPRRCIELTLKGHPCGLKPVQGRDRCYIHGLYRDLDGSTTINVPLLEDEDSLLIVYSQTARSLAQGRIPAAFANGILRACRGAERVLMIKLRREELEERKRAREERASKKQGNAGHPVAQPEPDQVLAAHPTENASTQESTEETAGAPYKPGVGLCGRGDVGLCGPEGTESNASPEDMGAASESEPQPWTVPPNKTHRSPVQFPYVREDFDDDIARMEGKWMDMYLAKNRAMRERGEVPGG